MHRGCGWLVVCLALGGCDSPEAKRSRGGGPGGDPQNRPRVVEMHGGSREYWETPVLIPEEAEAPSLEPARHAQRVSQTP
jgi:hypothetical protein